MAKYELPIYGTDDAIVKTYATNIVPWAVFVQAAELQESLKDKTAVEQMKYVGDVLKSIFHDLTDEELLCADANDVMNTFAQVVSGGKKIGGNSKNA